MSRVFSLWLSGFSRQPQGHALERGRLCRGGGARPGLFASQKRGRAGQRSERRQRAAYFFTLLGQAASPCLL
ncbi:hypothetical protein [Paenibacillus sp. 1-18]|uniref:hypothetical protein n=1 Tax=Paenibacillus sp. 1-18 TaxID=1333846 RepID=UPI0012DCB42C|nr:hypothetical protein [Paenibacillus sp. 1-18]